jgi:deoxycytidylate deaminase
MQKTPNTNQNFVDIDQEIGYFQNPEFYQLLDDNNEFIQAAKSAAVKYSLTSVFPIGIVAEKGGEIIGEAGNGNGYHENNLETSGHRKGCVRRHLNDEREKRGQAKFKGGEGFELCPGCHADSHAEANLIKRIKEENKYAELNGANVYMYGHFWCCKPCWQKMLDAGIKNVYLPKSVDQFKTKEGIANWAQEVASARKN